MRDQRDLIDLNEPDKAQPARRPWRSPLVIVASASNEAAKSVFRSGEYHTSGSAQASSNLSS
jgi:hypothetical protein